MSWPQFDFSQTQIQNRRNRSTPSPAVHSRRKKKRMEPRAHYPGRNSVLHQFDKREMKLTRTASQKFPALSVRSDMPSLEHVRSGTPDIFSSESDTENLLTIETLKNDEFVNFTAAKLKKVSSSLSQNMFMKDFSIETHKFGVGKESRHFASISNVSDLPIKLRSIKSYDSRISVSRKPCSSPELFSNDPSFGSSSSLLDTLPLSDTLSLSKISSSNGENSPFHECDNAADCDLTLRISPTRSPIFLRSERMRSEIGDTSGSDHCDIAICDTHSNDRSQSPLTDISSSSFLSSKATMPPPMPTYLPDATRLDFWDRQVPYSRVCKLTRLAEALKRHMRTASSDLAMWKCEKVAYEPDSEYEIISTVNQWGIYLSLCVSKPDKLSACIIDSQPLRICCAANNNAFQAYRDRSPCSASKTIFIYQPLTSIEIEGDDGVIKRFLVAPRYHKLKDEIS